MRKHGVDPATVQGTGPDGRIVEADVLQSLRGQPPMPAKPAAANLSPMRRAVAAKVAESFSTVPHFYLRSTADVTLLLALREQAVDQVQETHHVRLSLTDLVLRAVALALRDCPQANSIWRDGSVTRLERIDVGLVVKVRDGLMVPVIRQADRLTLPELARRRAELVEAVGAERLPAEAREGGATAVSNLGERRVQEFAPIINPPHSSMLGLGRAAPRPAVVENRLCIRQTLCLTLAVDHRVMDGDPAAEFLDRIVELLEHPFPLFCEVSPS